MPVPRIVCAPKLHYTALNTKHCALSGAIEFHRQRVEIMSTESDSGSENKQFVDNMVESALRIGLIFILLFWSYQLISPFVIPILWGAIIAVALMPVMLKLKALLGGRHATAATLLTLLGVATLVVPTIILSDSIVGSVQTIAAHFEQGDINIPKPPPEVAGWPFIGELINQIWTLASNNLEAALQQIEPQLRAAGTWLLSQVASTLVSVLMFIISIIIAGLFMAKAGAAVPAIKHMVTRLVGEQGSEWVDLSGATVRSVVQGVLGVAVIQAFLASIGLFFMDVPAAGLWTVIVLLLAIMQLPPILILGPIIVYVFSYADMTPAVIFAVWCILTSFADAVLKPLLMGRGLDVPMPIILMGAIGGMLMNGILGLFSGAVVLAIGYKLFGVWLSSERA